MNETVFSLFLILKRQVVTLFGEHGIMARIPRWLSQQSSRIALSNDSVFNDSNETIQKCISLKLFNVLTTQKSSYGNFIAQVVSPLSLDLSCPIQSKIASDLVTNAIFVTVCFSVFYQYCLRQSDMLIYQGQTIVFIS